MPAPALSSAIARYVIPWRERSWPLDLAHELGRCAPLALEIGFGNAEYLCDLARAHPERDHVGIELSWTSVRRLLERLGHEELPNVRALSGDAELLLERLFPPASLCAVFINHPCPWPKARHAGRRLVKSDFLALLASRMAPDAELLIVTDHAEHALWVAEALESRPELCSRHPTTEVPEIPGRRPTKYERKAMSQGIPIHYFEWRKRADSPPAAADWPEPSSPAPASMPTLKLRGPRRDDLLDDFVGLTHHERKDEVDVVVKLTGAYRSTDGSHWLVAALVQEDKLRQELALLVIPRPDGVLIKLGSLGHPHATYGVKRAVWLLGRLLREREAALEPTHENLGDASGEE